MGKRFKKKKASAHVYNLMTRNMTSKMYLNMTSNLCEHEQSALGT